MESPKNRGSQGSLYTYLRAPRMRVREKQMRRWYSLTCPVCGFRYPLKKFGPSLDPILYPLAIVTGGGRARGFKIVKYLPWSALPSLKDTAVETSLQCLYSRLSTAYDFFYETLGFLSPRMKALLRALQGSYPTSYQTSPYENYHKAFTLTDSTSDIAESYGDDDYPSAYAVFLSKLLLGGLADG